MGLEEDQENIETSRGTPNPKVLTSPQGYVLSLPGGAPLSQLLEKLKSIVSVRRVTGFPRTDWKEEEPQQERKQLNSPVLLNDPYEMLCWAL